MNTIQETWDGDVDARLSSQCVCERLATFASKFGTIKDKDSGFSPSEFDTAEVSSLYQADVFNVNVHIHMYNIYIVYMCRNQVHYFVALCRYM